jgi:hypothetical protein
VDVETILKGKDAVKNYIRNIRLKGKEASKKELDVCENMLIFNEMFERGLEVLPIDLNKSHARKYLVEDGKGTEYIHDGYKVVYTKSDETADTYIERIMHELGPDYSIRMVTGDKLLQFSAVHSGISRMTAKEFLEELTRIGNEITEFVRRLSECKN